MVDYPKQFETILHLNNISICTCIRTLLFGRIECLHLIAIY